MVGTYFPGAGQVGATPASVFQNTIGHAAVGCASAMLSGGDCGSGALSSGIAAAYGNYGSGGDYTTSGYSKNPYVAVFQNAVIGGTASELGGGKFGNGAVTAAFGYLFNCEKHECWKDLRAGTCTTPSIACSQQNARYQEAYDTIAKGQAIESDHPELFFVGGIEVKGAGWVFGAFKSEAKWAAQLESRGWTSSQISEAIQFGKGVPAVNMVNKTNEAIRYIHPGTGQSVVIDTITREVLHVGGKGFKY